MEMHLIALLMVDFLAFAQKALNELEGLPIGNDPYLELLATEAIAFLDGPTNRLVVNLPPRHLKTKFFSVCLAAWKLAHDPTAKILVVTYSEQLAASIARDIRSILRAPWFAEVFRTRVAKDHSAVMDFGTTAGGQLYATSFSGSITGRGADLIITDDPHDINDAGKPMLLRQTCNIFFNTVINRLNTPNKGKIVIIAHRIHELDLSARVLRGSDWRHVALPLVATTDKEYVTDYGVWRRRKGDVLRPDAYNAKTIDERRADTVNPCFDLLFQQDVDGTALPAVSREDFLNSHYAHVRNAPCIMSIDPNFKAGPNSSFGVVQIWRPSGGGHCLIDQWREQCNFNELIQATKKLCARHLPSVILIEQSANGYALGPSLNAMFRKLVVEITPRGSKRARFLRNVDTVLARKILLPAAAVWREDFVSECVSFPHCEYTDQVDALSQYLDFMKDSPPLHAPPSRSLGVVAGPRGTIRAEMTSFARFGRRPC
jgi:predicted phage terminase large subunit-like protein